MKNQAPRFDEIISLADAGIVASGFAMWEWLGVSDTASRREDIAASCVAV